MGRPGLITQSGLAAVRPSAGDPADRPNGHCVDSSNREDGCGYVTTLHSRSRVRTVHISHPPFTLPKMPYSVPRSSAPTFEKLPKLNFLSSLARIQNCGYLDAKISLRCIA
jgi:hypothetical protein